MNNQKNADSDKISQNENEISSQRQINITKEELDDLAMMEMDLLSNLLQSPPRYREDQNVLDQNINNKIGEIQENKKLNLSSYTSYQSS